MNLYSDKEQELKKNIDDLSSRVGSNKSGMKCIPTALIAGVSAPIAIASFLAFFQPGFVKRKEGNKMVKDNYKIFYWTTILTVLFWLGLYLYSYCVGFSNVQMLCSKYGRS